MTWLTFDKFPEMHDLITKVLTDNNIYCNCGKRFTKNNLNVKIGKDDTFWIYTHCNICLYDLNYNKILKQAGVESK